MYAVRKAIQTATLDTAVGNITTAAWKAVVATAKAAGYFSVFNPSGSTLAVSLDGVNAEAVTVPPGGMDAWPLEIKAGQSLSFKALDANVTSGIVIVNLHD